MSETANFSDQKQFCAEISKQGRASCKKCKQKCLQGELRIAKLVPSPSGSDKIKNWYHLNCIFETFLSQRQTTKRIEHLYDIDGLDQLSEDHKAEIHGEILESNKTLKLKTKHRKKQKSNNKKTIIQTNNCEDALSCSSDVSYKESHEDNSFRKFRTIIVNVSQETSSVKKIKVINELFTKGSDGTGFKSDIYLWCKLLLPAIDKRIFDLQTNEIIKIFCKIFHINQKEMLEYLEQADLGQTIQYYFEHNKNIKPIHNSYITIEEVDDFLDKLSCVTKEDEQISLFRTVIKKCTANDLKVIIRWIRHDLRMFAETKHVLDAVHHNAYKMFQSSYDLRTVISNCSNPPPIVENSEDIIIHKTPRKRRTKSESLVKSLSRTRRNKSSEHQKKKAKKRSVDVQEVEDLDAVFNRLKNSETLRPQASKTIPNYFENMKLLLEDGVAECQAECVRYFIAFGGVVLNSNDFDEATHVLHVRDTVQNPTIESPKSAKHVIVKWIRDTVDKDCLQDFRPYTVRWDPKA